MLYVFFTLILVRLLPVVLFFLIFWKIVRLLFSWTSGSWPPPGGPGGPRRDGPRQQGEGSNPPPGSGGSRRRPRNPYEVLGCSPSATDDEVKKRYRELLSRYHPDKFIGQGYDEEFVNLASRRFQEIREAYETIRSSRKF